MEEEEVVVTAPQLRGVQINGILMLDQGVTISGTMLRVAGVDYMVGPALYRISAPAVDYQSVLGEFGNEIAHSKHSAEYVPSTEWPACIALDNAVVCSITPAEEREVVQQVRH